MLQLRVGQSYKLLQDLCPSAGSRSYVASNTPDTMHSLKFRYHLIDPSVLQRLRCHTALQLLRSPGYYRMARLTISFSSQFFPRHPLQRRSCQGQAHNLPSTPHDTHSHTEYSKRSIHPLGVGRLGEMAGTNNHGDIWVQLALRAGITQTGISMTEDEALQLIPEGCLFNWKCWKECSVATCIMSSKKAMQAPDRRTAVSPRRGTQNLEPSTRTST